MFLQSQFSKFDRRKISIKATTFKNDASNTMINFDHARSGSDMDHIPYNSKQMLSQGPNTKVPTSRAYTYKEFKIGPDKVDQNHQASINEPTVSSVLL